MAGHTHVERFDDPVAEAFLPSFWTGALHVGDRAFEHTQPAVRDRSDQLARGREVASLRDGSLSKVKRSVADSQQPGSFRRSFRLDRGRCGYVPEQCGSGRVVRDGVVAVQNRMCRLLVAER
jgi:hypothetical protein